ncbi:MAG: CYTH domain-containing protein [Spirochaetaceae bacterium]|jgi:predicted adenylyl cyclase CyaB|nr:CYTH domain-containing protein [Spirochaetaceae bacterium]
MVYEIELKAWATDHETLRQALLKHAQFECEYVKEDTYYLPGPKAGGNVPASGVRLRRETVRYSDGDAATMLLTYKSKERREEIEINSEHEYAITGDENIPVIEALFMLMGLERAYTKTKRGFAFRHGDITAELSLVEGLGWFIELEILRDNDAAATLEAARASLKTLLHTLGIAEENIETRYYSELLNTIRAAKTTKKDG